MKKAAGMTASFRRKIVVLEAPSNLGLRPPEEGAPPGCYKAPRALRDRGLIQAWHAEEAGAVVPARYKVAAVCRDGADHLRS